MPVDFSSAAKAARAQLAVPAIDMDAIGVRSRTGVGVGLRARVFSWAIALGVLGTAAALAAGAHKGIHLWMSGNTMEAAIQSFAQVRAPMASDVERIANSAAFPVTLPVGVPTNYRVVWIAYSPSEHPTLITIKYETPSGAPAMAISVVQTSSIERNRALLPPSPTPRTATHGWHFEIGSETVLVQGRHVTSAQVLNVERTMQSKTPAQALADLQAHLTPLLVLAPVPSVPLELAAERLAPASGTNMLLARWALHELALRAQANEPLRDPRPITVTNIPSVNGQPDYRNATVVFDRPIAIQAGAVKSIESILRRAKVGPGCSCAIVVHQANGNYDVWKIDASTLKVTRLRS